ncbi:TolC family protein [Paraflavisolibacter sp. H34]|uniref:TolC family protein n=1 Tax=Huijunlia imazamoxiresistens TaxID=3127457 RepID=UPI003019E9CE
MENPTINPIRGCVLDGRLFPGWHPGLFTMKPFGLPFSLPLKTGILIIGLLITFLAIGQKTLTLEDCYELARAQNTTLKRAQNTVDAQLLDRQTARHRQLPTASMNFGHWFSYGKNIDPVTNVFINESFSGGNMGLDIDLKLFSGLQTFYTIKQSGLLLQASEYEKKRTELEVLTNTTLCYAQMLYNREQLLIVRNQQQTTARELEIANEKIKVGRADKNEYYLLLSRQHTEEANLVSARNDSMARAQELKQLLNLPYTEKIEIAPPDTAALARILQADFPLAALLEEVLSRHPALQQARMTEQASQMGEKVARSSLFPTLSVGGNLVSNYNRSLVDANGDKLPLRAQLNNNFGQNIYLTLRVPIYAQKEFSNRVKKEKISSANSRLALTETEQTVVGGVLRLVNDFNLAKQKFRATQAALEQSSLAYAVYTEKYRLGRAGSLELVTAKDLLYAAQARHLQAKLELFFQHQLLQLLRNAR